MRSVLIPVLLWLLAVLSTSCSEDAVAALRVELRPDLGGKLTASSLMVADRGGPAEDVTAGVSWETRANLYCASASFASLDAVEVGGITFAAGSGPGGPSWLRVTLPRGEDGPWTARFLPSRDDRRRVARTFDPNGNLGSATTQFAIQVDLPGAVVSHGVSPREGGIASDATAKRATLTVPIDRAIVDGEPFVWDVTWK